MTALGILAQARAAGLTLRPAGDKIRFKPVGNMTPELLAEVREHKGELLDLLRAGREAEVRAFYSQAFGRLGALYPDSLLGNLWPTIVAEQPYLARGIDTAEAASDRAALDYQSGTAPDATAFLSCLREWESRWREGIEAVTASPDRCSDCGRTDATVMVTTDTGRYCRHCLRPAPIGQKGQHHA